MQKKRRKKNLPHLNCSSFLEFSFSLPPLASERNMAAALSWLTVLLYPKKDSNPTVEEHEHGKVSKQIGDGGLSSYSAHAASGVFQMPLHYPRYTKADYEKMEEWRLDLLLKQYGLTAVSKGTLQEKRAYAIGAFLWPGQY
jgi:hypothetical protein